MRDRVENESATLDGARVREKVEVRVTRFLNESEDVGVGG